MGKSFKSISTGRGSTINYVSDNGKYLGHEGQGVTQHDPRVWNGKVDIASDLNGTYPLLQFNGETEIKIHHKIIEEKPHLDEDRVRKAVSSVKKHIDQDLEDCRNKVREASMEVALENVFLEEITLLKLAIQQGLDSVTRDNISIIKYADHAEIRGKEKTKTLGKDAFRAFNQLFRKESRDEIIGFASPAGTSDFYQGVDKSNNLYGQPPLQAGDISAEEIVNELEPDGI